MAVYTTQIRSWLRMLAGNPEIEDPWSIVAQTHTLVFQNRYPIFDENYRAGLEQKILLHYYMREIGLETVGLFKLFLQRKMTEIMPYYNQLYESALLEFNPLFDVELNRTHNRKENGTDNLTGNGTVNTSGKSETDSTFTTDVTTSTNRDNNSTSMYSDTPQNGIGDVQSGRYLTNATVGSEALKGSDTSKTQNTSNDMSNNSGETTSTNKSDRVVANTEDYVEKVTGKQGTQSYSSLVKEFRETFLNIDMMIIEELGELFMGIY